MKNTVRIVLLLCLILFASTFVFTACNNTGASNTTEGIPSEITILEKTTTPEGITPPEPHVHIEEILSAVAPTCTTTGLTEGKYCSVCDEVLVAQEIIPALEHDFGEWVIVKESTTTEEGLQERVCGCGETETKIIKKYSAGLEFTLNDDGESYSVTGIGTCTDTEVVIPTTYNGKQVTAIGNKAFHCSDLTNIIIPNSIISIGDWAFDACYDFTSVIIPNSVTTIGNGAFADCYNLTSATIGDSVTTIGWGAFHGCDNLTSIIVDENNVAYQSINENLYSKDGTVLVVYTSGKSDTSFVIPDFVTIIGNRAFADCDNLMSVTIPDSITIIEHVAFHDCDNLRSITIPDSVTIIKSDAFESCDNLTSVTIGDSVITIGDQAFCSCNNLASLKIGNSVTIIGNDAFKDCDNLTSVTIPNSVTQIGLDAFGSCSNLTSIHFSGTKSQWNAIFKSYFWISNSYGYTIYCTDGTISHSQGGTILPPTTN